MGRGEPILGVDGGGGRPEAGAQRDGGAGGNGGCCAELVREVGEAWALLL
jgi:hypothetical protein